MIERQLDIGKTDWWAVMAYLALVFLGWGNIYSVLQEEGAGVFDFTTRHGKQMIWIGVSLFLAVAILLIDDKYYHVFAYPLYWLLIVVLVAVVFVGKEVNGAKAWIMIGGQGIQPAEFAKFATALALSRYMSRYNFSPTRLRDVVMAFAFIGLPALIVIAQKDTGSAMVFAAFMVVFYREGMNGWIFTLTVAMAALFIFAMLFTPLVTLILTILALVVAEGLTNGRWRSKLTLLALLSLGSLGIWFGAQLTGFSVQPYYALLACSVAAIPFVLRYGAHTRRQNVRGYVLMFAFCVLFTRSADYIFERVLEPHQKVRILDTLGLENDVSNVGYQTNQSKIAIGSGGWLGKGYLEGTQTRFSFVPEQSTDYIFCTVGEEWGFVGAVIVVGLFFFLVLRLLRMAERQGEPFNRVYIYSVASIFMMHIVINIGMTLGIMPVIGIPLPLFSYGGSSLLAFTILFFVAVKLGTTKRDVWGA